MRCASMKLERKRDGWWITMAPPYTHRKVDGSVETYDSYGPYDTKFEADSVRKGLTATLEKVKT